MFLSTVFFRHVVITVRGSLLDGYRDTATKLNSRENSQVLERYINVYFAIWCGINVVMSFVGSWYSLRALFGCVIDIVADKILSVVI